MIFDILKHSTLLLHEHKCECFVLLYQGLLWETLHAIGEAILVVKVFPYLDSTYLLLLIPVISFIPSIVNLHAKVLSLQRNKEKGNTHTEQFYHKKLHVLFSALALVSI